jgi:hypothetical protein
LRSDFALVKPTNTNHTEITIDSSLLDKYAGRYKAQGEGIFIVARENNFLTIESPADWGFRNCASVQKARRISSPPSCPCESRSRSTRRVT